MYGNDFHDQSENIKGMSSTEFILENYAKNATKNEKSLVENINFNRKTSVEVNNLHFLLNYM